MEDSYQSDGGCVLVSHSTSGRRRDAAAQRTPVPFLSQHYSVPVGFSNSRGCGITSAAMILAYYGRIVPYTITGANGNPSPYGWYTTRAYRYKSPYHDVKWTYWASQEHRPGLQGWGAWGFIWRNGTDKTLTDLLPFLQAHDFVGKFVKQPSEQYTERLVKQEINQGRPLIANTEIIGGHYVVIYGYDATGGEFKYLVNDPWNGRMAYTYEQLMVSQQYRGLLLLSPCNNFTAKAPYSPGMTATRSYVSPLKGTSTTSFTYELPVVVPNKTTPTVTVYVDGTPYKMTLRDGMTYSGTYTFATKLNPGVHSYYFSIETPDYTVWFPPDAGVWPNLALSQFQGPYVEPLSRTGTLVLMQIMNDKYLVNGEARYMDMPPILKSGRTFLPIRYVAEPLGASVQWDAKTQKVTITSRDGATKVELWVGKNYAFVDGTKKLIDADPTVTPMLVNGRTLLPLRFVAEALGAKVNWDNNTKSVTLVRQK
ncbi:copper amine oxidase [Coprothermobacteraceae bacterium]|nr:copper amine oxidase [Coprothermobacteraceae bacterium]